MLFFSRLYQQMQITGQRASAIPSEELSYSISCLLLPIIALPCSTTWQCMRKKSLKGAEENGGKFQGTKALLVSCVCHLFAYFVANEND